MSFEAYIPSTRGRRQGIHPGECSIGRNGVLAISSHDLTKVGIRNQAVMLIDRQTCRIALRAPATDHLDHIVVTISGKPTAQTRRCASARGALRAIGIDPAACAGRHPLEVKLSGGPPMLIVNLLDAAKKQKAKRK